MLTPPKLMLPAEYVTDAAKHIRNAKSRVSFLSMVVADDSTTDELIDALAEAAERGVTVEVAADVFTYNELGGFIIPSRYRSKQKRATTRMSRQFRKSGVKFTWLGRSHSFIFSGRTHIKWCIVDDTIYSFGGVNLYQKGIENYDYMFRVTDEALATTLIDEYHRLTRADAGGYAYRSHSFMHGEDTILIDGGIFGDSIIYRRAYKLAKEAKRVIFVSQYCPTGRLSRVMKQTKTNLYFNQPTHAPNIHRLAIGLGMLITGNKTLYKKSRYLHAKFMLFYMSDGRKIALTGSHNLSNAGVLLGTREIALQTENPDVVRQLEAFVKDITD
jgi:cardiolipin synthase